MGVFTFVCRNAGGKWTAKEHEGDLEATAESTYDLQQKLVQSALSCDSYGGVQTSFSFVTPSSAVFQVIVGGASGGFAAAGAASSAPAGGAGAAAEAAPAAEEKKEEKEESDDDMGFSLFD